MILPSMANRHGLVAGATGTGKTVTLQRMAESFHRIGVPVFLADIKGDLSGLSQAGGGNQKIQDRFAVLNIVPNYAPCSCTFYDLFGVSGQAITTPISSIGTLLLSRVLNLNATQSGVLDLAFKVAGDKSLQLATIADLRYVLQDCYKNAKLYTSTYGYVSSASIGTIQRSLLQIEGQGADRFFTADRFDIRDLLRPTISILNADRLIQSPQLYSTFMLWMLTELYQTLPEVGDIDKPKLVFFFDEAHLLFTDIPKPLLEKIEQTVRLIRSKGVGVYFVTQSPLDVPKTILAQLGNRVQHALRAFTPNDYKAVKVSARSFRPNPKLDIERVITQLAVGEALVSMLDATGTPEIVQRVFVTPPESHVGIVARPIPVATVVAAPVAMPVAAIAATVRPVAVKTMGFIRRAVRWYVQNTIFATCKDR